MNRIFTLAATAVTALTITACKTNSDGSAVKEAGSVTADAMTTEVRCRETNAPMDAGYNVEVRSGGIAGLTTAKISETWIGGVRNVQSIVVQSDEGGMMRTYSATDFSLIITLESFVATTRHPAELKFKKNGQSLTKQVTCVMGEERDEDEQPAAPAAERINVTEAAAFANLMPPLPPEFDGRVTATLKIEVSSWGCTDAASFEAKITQGEGSQTLEIKRSRVDACEVTEHRIQLELAAPLYKLGTKLLYNGAELTVTENIVY